MMKKTTLLGLVIFGLLFIQPPAALAGTNEDLIDAALRGDSSQVEESLNQGAELNYQDEIGYTALMWAASEGHTEIIRLLLARGADKSLKSNSAEVTARDLAESNSHPDIVELLDLDSGASASAEEPTAETQASPAPVVAKVAPKKSAAKPSSKVKPPAKPKPFVFQNVVFGETPAQLTKKLKKFSLVKRDANSCWYAGKVGNDDARLLALFSAKSKKLWKLVVYFDSYQFISYPNLRSKYEHYVSVLRSKYGAPDREEDEFVYPYEDNHEGSETYIIQLGKANISTDWVQPGGFITCKIRDNLAVSVAYEHKWYSELDSREKESTDKQEL